MSEILSFTRMKEDFDGEWVLVADPDTTDSLNVTRGRVLYHSKNRDEVYRKAMELKPEHSAILYLGQLPDNVAVVL